MSLDPCRLAKLCSSAASTRYTLTISPRPPLFKKTRSKIKTSIHPLMNFRQLLIAGGVQIVYKLDESMRHYLLLVPQ